jgi:hypothetical protein|tara:strand:+ start:741 stop:1040 length:300 start_codon:yes stop_codon:yes gene_type:complete
MENKNTICPPIAGIGGMTDLEVFACFNIEVDETGNDLWEFRVIPKKRKSAREHRIDMTPEEADLMIDKVGRAGSLERVAALVEHYQTKEEKSPFLPLTD